MRVSGERREREREEREKEERVVSAAAPVSPSPTLIIFNMIERTALMRRSRSEHESAYSILL
jgi:hypothetical protein